MLPTIFQHGSQQNSYYLRSFSISSLYLLPRMSLGPANYLRRYVGPHVFRGILFIPVPFSLYTYQSAFLLLVRQEFASPRAHSVNVKYNLNIISFLSACLSSAVLASAICSRSRCRSMDAIDAAATPEAPGFP